MRPAKTFKVVPDVPARIGRLKDIAYNLWWSWNYECMELIRRVDRELWEATDHNPVKMLGMVSQVRLDKLSEDPGFLAHYDRVAAGFDEYMCEETWCQRRFGSEAEGVIAYFSAEFGITESLAIYSGGLGILAGDHLKSSSDLGLPLVGVGLLYQRGNFRQFLNYDGWQGEKYFLNDFFNMCVREEFDPEGRPVIVSLDVPGGALQVKVWSADVGRVKLYLLDSNIPENGQADREITGELYGGDRETRIRQEMLLGIGGMKALAALGIRPEVCHMNEGHSAFLGLERIRQLMEGMKLSFDEALEIARGSTIFTTHTPIPAGIDVFPDELVTRYLGNFMDKLNISIDRLLKLGKEDGAGKDSGFSMALLAFRLSERCNGVSRLHGRVSREIFGRLWPDIPVDEVPVGHVTNGIHSRSWISNEMGTLYYRYIGERWHTNPEDQDIWKNIEEIPPEEIWRTHERRRERLVAFARARLRRQLISRGAPASEIKKADEVLDPECMTIGFARRFATYKRADLILRNPDRLAAILNNDKMPVQIIFSGKAHPKDTPGKELIRELVRFTERPEFRKRIVFVEDYDMNVARYLVQGVDVWLNTPRRLYEASGTSGMKASANGVLNISILGGWWDEAYQPGIGWAIGKVDEYEDLDYQYDVEANAIYDLLEKEVVPLFYERGSDRIPRGWTRYMKGCVKNLNPLFNAHRMLLEYAERYYEPAGRRFRELSAEDCLKARTLAEFRARMARSWGHVRLENLEFRIDGAVPINQDRDVAVDVLLSDDVGPDDVEVQVLEGPVDPDGNMSAARIDGLDKVSEAGENRYRFTGIVKCGSSGLRGIAVRAVPKNPLLDSGVSSGMVKWAG